MRPIRTYAVNLPARTERRQSVLRQFEGRTEFDLQIVDGIEHPNGPYGLWKTFCGIVEKENASNSEYFIFCEDDHVFTDHYSKDVLIKAIDAAKSLDADLLSGGMSVVEHPIEVADGLFWVDKFNGMQFTVIFRKCFDRILACSSHKGYAPDIFLSYVAQRKYVISPYVSIQAEFGYSDATDSNSVPGVVSRSFAVHQDLLTRLRQVRNFYSQIPQCDIDAIMSKPVEEIRIAANVIHLPEHNDRYEHICRQFNGRVEYQLNIVEATRHDVGAVGLWQSICRIVSQAKAQGEAFVLICEDDHTFTPGYSGDKFIHQIMLGAAYGADVLSGGVGDFSNLVPLSGGLAWVDRFWCTQFIVIYRKAFNAILNCRFSIRDVADEKLSELFATKLVCVPFVSEQTDFGYSDVTMSNHLTGMISRHFEKSRRMLSLYTSGNDPESTTVGDKLNLGCGNNLIEGWVNADLHPVRGARFINAKERLPFGDGELDCVLAEHLVESLALGETAALFSEVSRCLKKGGKIVLSVYVSDIIGKIMLGQETDYVRANNSQYGIIDQRLASCPDIAIGNAVDNYVNRFKNATIYSSKALVSMLEMCGFRSIEVLTAGSLAECVHKPAVPRTLYECEAVTIVAYKQR